MLSMLSTIPTVKLQTTGSVQPSHLSSTSSSVVVTSVITTTSNNLSSPSQGRGPLDSLSNVSDMSRRKQRNPKPLMASSEGEGEMEEAEDQRNQSSTRESEEDEEDNSCHSPGPQDLSGMVKVEVTEDHSRSINHSNYRSEPGERSSYTPSPPGSDMHVLHAMPLPQPPPLSRHSRILKDSRHNLDLSRESPSPGSSGTNLPHQGMEDFFAKNNMLHFGDVLVGNHPDAPPVPMVIPMVYLLPVLTKDGGRSELRYKMFVPLNGQEPIPLHPPIPPHITPMAPMPMNDGAGPSCGSIDVRRPKTKSPGPLNSRKRKTSASSDHSQSRRDCTTPLDLSKSPKSEIGGDYEAEDENEDHIEVSNEQDENLRPHAKRLKNRSPSENSNPGRTPPLSNVAKDQVLHNKQSEIEAHFNFLRVKHLEFLKNQTQLQPAGAVVSESRCEECNINFSKHQNYVAHKKYYCSSGNASSSNNGSSKVAGAGGTGTKSAMSGSEMEDQAKGQKSSSPVNNGGLKLDGRTSVKSQSSGRSLPPPSPIPQAPPSHHPHHHHALPPLGSMSAAAALELLSMTSEANLGKDMLLLKQQHELLMKSESNPQVAIGLLGKDFMLPPPQGSLNPTKQPSASSPTSGNSLGSCTPPAGTIPTSSSSGALSPANPASHPPGLSHFVCEGCGIKFKSVTNLQAHKARYCAGLRKAEEINAFEAMMKRAQLPPQPQFPMALSAAEMMSFLNAKSLEQQAKMAAAAAAQAAVAAASTRLENSHSKRSLSPSGSNNGPDDFCCILCGFKEHSVERLKEHINMHFIGQIKRQPAEETDLKDPDNSLIKVTSPKAIQAQRTSTVSPTNSSSHEGETAHPASDDQSGGSPKSSPPSPGQPRLTLSLSHKRKAISEDVDCDTTKDASDTKGHDMMRKLSNQTFGLRKDNEDSPNDGTLPKRTKSEDNGRSNHRIGSDLLQQTPSSLRCEPCDIGFSHLSNYMAHKKYYCRGPNENAESTDD
ncbi:zinc finger protein ZFPM1-like isoform X2 [Tigriopus californicus]|uniref:zinc finger protein ZFPM1-like isoform X2 n=1 Tax=Tigriopus californicus TaxID=6832 RepID=UPI0027DA740F|nr:zinc finger protein ZFPM1-like isoform X2 [Tigriopus californicus]